MFEIRKSDTVEISKEICIILFIVKYLIFNAKIGEILYFWAKPLFINFKKGGFMKKVMFMFISLLTVLGVCSCNDNEVIEPVVSDSVSDMEVLSRFVDVNEITNEYYFNENKKTRALSYVTGSDWQDLEKVSPLSIEKYKNNLQVLNAQVASAISNPNTAYVVFSVNGKTLVKKVKEDANFDFSVFRDVVTETRAVLPSLSINGGSQSTTGVFYDSSRTLKMQVDLNLSLIHI